MVTIKNPFDKNYSPPKKIVSEIKILVHINAYKLKYKNTNEHTFLDGTKFKGNYQIKFHEFLDNLYLDLAKEYKNNGTKNTLQLIKSLLKQ